ncbi:MAG: alpha/beta hydrolase [Nitrospirae bacterium]|nr:alpha/beta hydrolase [Nitrospirota bacterium]
MKHKSFLIFLIFILWSCGGKDFSETDVHRSIDLTGHWDGIPQGYPDKPKELFFAVLSQRGQHIEGTLTIFYYTADNETSAITGTADYGSIRLQTADNKTFTCGQPVENPEFDCTWAGIAGSAGGSVSFYRGNSGESLPQNIFINSYDLQKQGGTGPPVIFIHGMYSTAATWNAFGLLDKLKTKGFFDKHEVWTYQFDWTAPIEESARDLHHRIETLGMNPPVFVAHSMGGLVARSYVALGGNTAKIITLGSPHMGFPVNKLSRMVRWFDVAGGHDLQYDSDFIRRINSDPRDISHRDKYVTFSAQMGLCCEENTDKRCLRRRWCRDYPDWLKKTWLLNEQDNDGLVPVDSALLSSGLPVQKYLDHVDLLDPSKSDAIVQYLLGL